MPIELNGPCGAFRFEVKLDGFQPPSRRLALRKVVVRKAR